MNFILLGVYTVKAINRKQLLNIIKVIVSVILLTLIFINIDTRAFLRAISQANPWLLIAALSIMMLSVVVKSFRWQILLDAIGVHVPLSELTAIYFIGFLFNNLLPSGLGGDAIRVLELNRHTERTSDAVTSVLVDRFVGLSALQAIALFALLLDWGAVPAVIAYFTVMIFSGGLAVGYLLINRSLYLTLQKRLKIFWRMTQIKMIGSLFESFQRYPLAALGKAYLVSILFNILLISINICIGWSLGIQASLAQYAIFVPITSLVLVIPISFAGLGVREETYRQLFGQIGVAPELAVALSLLYYTIGNICTGLVGGVIYLLRSVRDVVSES